MRKIVKEKFKKYNEKIIDDILRRDECIKIVTEDGNCVVLSENKYRSILDTVFLMNSPKMYEKLKKGKYTNVNECIDENEVIW